MVRGIAVASLCAVLSSSAFADDAAPTRVAVVPGIAVNLDTARVDALSQDLAESLQATLVVEAIGGLEVRRQLPPDGLPPDCVTQPACIADVAKRTGAAQLLFVVMVDSGAGGSVQIDTTWVDAASGKTVSRPAIDLTSIADARAKFTTSARVLLPDAPVRGRVAPVSTVRIEREPGMAVPRHFTTPAKITAAVGGVGLVSGVTFFFLTRSAHNACENDPLTCTNDDRDSIRNRALIADISFGIAIGAAITTGILYATSGETPAFTISPTSDGAAVTALGRF